MPKKEVYFIAFWDSEGGGVEECDTLEQAEERIEEMEEEADETGCTVQGVIKGKWIKKG